MCRPKIEADRTAVYFKVNDGDLKKIKAAADKENRAVTNYFVTAALSRARGSQHYGD